MKNNISKKHEKIFDFLIGLHEKDSSFFFVPRKADRKGRFEKHYWFIGSSRYLQVSFWNGSDWKEKIHNIGFNVRADGSSYVELSAQDSKAKAEFLHKVVDRLGGFVRVGKKDKWQRQLPGNDYIAKIIFGSIVIDDAILNINATTITDTIHSIPNSFTQTVVVYNCTIYHFNRAVIYINSTITTTHISINHAVNHRHVTAIYLDSSASIRV